jgi:hypothetical protein
LGAIGTTYVKPYTVKLVMGVIMLLVLLSRGVAIPVYLADLQLIGTMSAESAALLKNASFGMMIFALGVGAFIVLQALLKGMRQHQGELAAAPHFSAAPLAATTGGDNRLLRRIMLVTDNSEFSEGATREAIRMAQRCGSQLHVLTVLPVGDIETPLAHSLLKQAK